MSRRLAHCTVAFLALAAAACSEAPETRTGGAINPPSEFTVAHQRSLRQSLPFDDRRDFDEQRRGFIAAPGYRQIVDEAGELVWDIGRYDFLLSGEDLDSIHPSLQRQATLNMNYGLYEVVPGKIYQVRGFDLSNMTLIRGDTGWIVFDVLLVKETAAAALEFANAELGELPVVAVIYSHSHADHFGGIRGVLTETQIESAAVPIIAPRGFMENAISENVYAGNAMGRRASYQYGRVLPVSPFGQVDSAIGKATASGTLGLVAPTRVIEKDFEEHTIDGVRMVFQNTPGTEAPAEMNTWFPDLKVFWAAENITATIHNVYTLRGALVRDAHKWSKGINEALYRFGVDAEVMLASHNWPRWGNERIQEIMRAQRDAYANLNNQVLHLANQGVTINEIHNEYEVPESLKKQWSVRQYHGSEFHNSRAVLNRYLGYWDGNPATLAPLSPADSAPLYVEMMGGADTILRKGRGLYDAGQYRHAMEIVNRLVYAEPDNDKAKLLLADIFEQLGYQYESASLRNSFLSAAQELRLGVPESLGIETGGPDAVRALTTSQWWDAIAIRVDSQKADGINFKLNFVTPDNGETLVVEMSNGTLTNIVGFTAADADATLTINRADLVPVMMQQATFATQLQAGKAKLGGNGLILTQLASTLVAFDPLFEMMPGTR
ncbi:MAG: MBL fold metallo-hydrolase [Gammaproteobacteria bacterium]|nr:MBL fold metallo-hydrolase [Gammaproteobacteria bacterium]MDH3362253.1 MBL fold metallo-hydrolase [Gammaproteobacteria bacterium]MDH3480283.1 MBL fold metallo-hydrolase [Gammaproteobacteria bacterium]